MSPTAAMVRRNALLSGSGGGSGSGMLSAISIGEASVGSSSLIGGSVDVDAQAARNSNAGRCKICENLVT
jgi:hypothetical protein